MENLNKCQECGIDLIDDQIIDSDRDECMDMCDHCYNEFIDRVNRMKDRDYRMEVTRTAVAWVNEFHHSNHKEAQYRAFFASVMQHEVETFINKNT